MRILLVHSFYKPGVPSGENNVVVDQAQLLRNHGHDVEVWGPVSPSSMGMTHKIRTGVSVLAGRGRDPQSFIREFQPDLIHVHNLFPSISLRWLSAVAQPIAMSIHNYRSVCANGVLIRDSRPCMDCLHGSSMNAIRHACYQGSSAATVPVLEFQRNLRLVISRDVDKLIYTSHLSREILDPLIPSRSTLVLPNYVAEVQKSHRAAARKDEPYYIVLGRLSPEKGIRQLLEIWPKNLKLKIVGDGPQKAELESLADPNAVEFIGFVSPEERDELIACAAALVLPSVTLEADPVVVAQALSAGTPCVVSANTSSARLSSQSAALHTFKDQESLEFALKSLQGSGIRAAARELYIRTWSADAWIQAYSKQVLA